MIRLFVPMLALVVASPVLAADVSVGVGLGAATDLPDRVSKDYAKFGLGPSLIVPIRVGLSEWAALRFTPRMELATGSDRVTWGRELNGEEVRFYDDDHFALLAAGVLSVGPEVVVPVKGNLAPYFGAEGGPAWVGTYHSLGGVTQPLLGDPNDPNNPNDLSNTRNVDPYTNQLAWFTELHVGARLQTPGVALWVETGYSSAFLGPKALEKTPAELRAMREAYGWNAGRLLVGVQIPLGSGR